MTGVAPTETLSYRIGAAHDLMQHILHDPANELGGILWGALSGLELILREAREYADEALMDEEKAMDATEEICKQRKPDKDDEACLTPYEDMCLALSEALELAAHSNDLVKSVLTDLPLRNQEVQS